MHHPCTQIGQRGHSSQSSPHARASAQSASPPQSHPAPHSGTAQWQSPSVMQTPHVSSRGHREVASESWEKQLLQEIRGLSPPTARALEQLVHALAQDREDRKRWS